jgi:hypothetical protein
VDGLFGSFCVHLRELAAGLDLVWNLSPLRQRAVTLLVMAQCLCDLVETCELLDWIADNGMEPEKLHIVLG